MGESRAASEMVGFLLIVAMVFIGLSVVFVQVGPKLADTQQEAQFGQIETGFKTLKSEAAAVASSVGDSTTRQVDLGISSTDEGTLYRSDRGHITVTLKEASGTTKTITNTSLGAIVYETDDAEIVYQNGGIWRTDKATGTRRTVSPPPFDRMNRTATFPIIIVSDATTIDGDTITLQKTTPENSTTSVMTQLEPGDSLQLSMQSAYYKQWAAYINHTLPNATITLNTTTQTVSATFNGSNGGSGGGSVGEQAPGTLSPIKAAHRYDTADEVHDIGFLNEDDGSICTMNIDRHHDKACSADHYILHGSGPGAAADNYARVGYDGNDTYISAAAGEATWNPTNGYAEATPLYPNGTDTNLVVNQTVRTMDGEGITLMTGEADDSPSHYGRVYVNGSLIVDNTTVGVDGYEDQLEFILPEDGNVTIRNGGELHAYVYFANATKGQSNTGCAASTICVQDTSAFSGGTNGAISSGSQASVTTNVSTYTPEVRDKQLAAEDFSTESTTTGTTGFRFIHVTVSQLGSDNTE